MSSPVASTTPTVYQVLANLANGETYCLINPENTTDKDKQRGFLLGKHYLVIRKQDDIRDTYAIDPDKVFAEVADYFSKLTLHSHDLPQDTKTAEKARKKVNAVIELYTKDESLSTSLYRNFTQTIDYYTGWQTLAESARVINSKMLQLIAQADVKTGGALNLAGMERAKSTFDEAARNLPKRSSLTAAAAAAATPAAAKPADNTSFTYHVVEDSPAAVEAVHAPDPIAEFRTLPLKNKLEHLINVQAEGLLHGSWIAELDGIFSELWQVPNTAVFVKTNRALLEKMAAIFKQNGKDDHAHWLSHKLSIFK